MVIHLKLQASLTLMELAEKEKDLLTRKEVTNIFVEVFLILF